MKFVIETSGSTGSAKKVVVDEQAYLGMAEVDCIDLGITSKSVVAMDRGGTAGWLNFYRAKVSGARLAIYPGADKHSLRLWISEQKITHLNTLATTFRWLASGLYKFPTVESLEIGGEVVDWADVPIARNAFPNAELYNRYATSEARIICRKHVNRDETAEGRMAVGKPVKGVSVAVVESSGGEIIVDSPYMSDGYYQDDELTAAKFKQGWYYTADVGRWLSNGELMVHGRRDFAVRPHSFSADGYLHQRNMASALQGGEVK